MCRKKRHNNAISVISGLIGLTLLLCLAVNLEPRLFSFVQSSIYDGSLHNEAMTGMFDTRSNPYGNTFAEWTAKWWQWAYSIPKDIHPAYDDTGKYCTVNQKGSVWFFPGSYGKDVIRQCNVPYDKSILFPILNSECSFAEFPSLKNEGQLEQCAKEIQDSVMNTKASVDGKNITNLGDYRVQSPLFGITLPENNILNLPPQNTQAVSDGNWIFLKPLSEGYHTISFDGSLRNVSNIETNDSQYVFAVPYGWDNNVTYHLTITDSSNEVPHNQSLE